MKNLKFYLLTLLLAVAGITKAQILFTTPDTVAACLGDTIVFNVLDNDSGVALELVDFSEIPESGSFSFTADGFITFIPDPADFNEFQEISYLVCSDDDDDDCSIEQISFYLQAFSDCVWPGDANVDGAANHFDLLNIGLFYGDLGPDRYDEDNSWDATYSDSWTGVPDLGDIVPKFADCNGDGLINANDTASIQLNYGLIHDLRITETDEFDATPLYIDIPEDTIPFDTAVILPIILGSDIFPATDIYGVAFSINYNADLIVPGTLAVNFDEGWLGSEGTDLFAMRYAPMSGVMDVSVSRNDKVSASGIGQIGTVSFVMESNLAGKVDIIYSELFEMCVSPSYRAINTSGEEIILSVGCDSVVVDDPGGDSIIYEIDLLIFPNPASTFVKVKVPGVEPFDGTAAIKNLAGVTLKTVPINSDNQAKIKVSNIPNGTYSLVVTLPYTVVVEPFVILH